MEKHKGKALNTLIDAELSLFVSFSMKNCRHLSFLAKTNIPLL